MLKNFRKVASALARVAPVRGLRHALKVAIGPEFASLGIWPIDAPELELLYHERQIVGVGGAAESKRALLDPSRHDEIVPPDLRPLLARHVPPSGQVLDVGAGPISRLTGGHHRGLYRLTATDLLADSYTQLLRIYGHERVLEGVTYVASPGERLASVLAAEFDFVSIHNALDHTSSPRQVMEQLSAVTKPGGVLVVSGRSREGTYEHWAGMHQHDLWLAGGVLRRCGRHGSNEENLAAGLPLEFIEGVEPADPHGNMVAVFRRS